MKLKQIPEDFEVQERINLDNLSARSDGFAREFSYFKVERRGVEQLRALDMIARYFKVPVRHVQCSGMKDAAAIARQLVSVYDVDADSIPAALPLDPQKRVRITFVGRFKSSLRDSDHEGNRFTIVVRDLSREEAASAPEKGHAAVKTGCINYFDEQRFGYAGNSDVIGRMML
ncbi:MAG: tRNA pseudouridine(13) synthase TruD, partial [Spirochaetia bacterium]|nr:tRNA pseudouridine(13) synthase TruD [Spirochaetia bacterium]